MGDREGMTRTGRTGRAGGTGHRPPPRLRITAAAAALALLASGCYWAQARHATLTGAPVPWFCHPTNPNSVTGPGMGSVNWYAGVTRGPLSHEECELVATMFDVAKAYAKRFPTRGAAEAAGFRSTFGFIPGMGTHHGLGAITPEMLADPNFDRRDPIIPDSIIDDVFDPGVPEFLQYNGNSPDSVLVGMSYYVRTTTGLPPAGFPGLNDWWHHHPTLCFNPTTAQAFAVNTTDTGCANQGGVNVHLHNYYMLHVWLVDDLELRNDVHAAFHPCIRASGAIFDMTHPCHQESSLGPPTGASAGASTGAGAATPGERTTTPAAFCPIALLGVGDEDRPPA
jgi:hypothetical protein